MSDDQKIWLVVEKQARADATMDECALCGGLKGAAMFPGMTSMVSPETVAKVMDSHEHYKVAYIQMLRVPAYSESHSGYVRIVPETDRMFIAPETGKYCLAVYDAKNLLMRCDIPLMTAGSTLDSLAMRAGVS